MLRNIQERNGDDDCIGTCQSDKSFFFGIDDTPFKSTVHVER